MEGGRVYGGPNMISLLDNSNSPLWIPSSSTSIHETMVNFDQPEIQQGTMRSSPKPNRNRGGDDGEDTGGEEFDISPFNHQGKKRRLTIEQVQFLEKSFEVENKLEPERKLQLAKNLGLEPRQVAIWFQNRRARYKTKQIEKDYDSLKASFDTLKADYDSLIKENQDLRNEVKLLTKKLNQGDIAQPSLEQHEGETKAETNIIVPKMEVVVAPSNKQVEDASSAKSDVFDSESPNCIEGKNNSSPLLDPDLQSDFSQDEEGSLFMTSKSPLLPTTTTTTTTTTMYNNVVKVEEGCYDCIGTCNFSFVDDHPIWPWPY